MTDKRTGWLAELNPGDEVGVEHRGAWRQLVHALDTVERITPTGRIVTAGARHFGPDGYRLAGVEGRLLPASEARPLVEAAQARTGLAWAVDRISQTTRDSTRLGKLTREQATEARALVEAALRLVEPQ